MNEDPRPDRCPYRRPFRADFDDCEAFQPVDFIALDLQHRALPRVLSCGHLVVGQGTASGSHYPRCRLGDAAARHEWVETVKSPRTEALKAIRRGSREVLGGHIAALFAAKGRTLQEPRDTAAQQALRSAAADYLQAAGAYYKTHTTELAAAGVALADLQELLSRVVEDWVASRSIETNPELPPEILSRFPPAVRAFLQPREPAAG
ncbi:MAG: hypothetical protein NVS9B1_03410 [Candidatus Dormibacteraceae bacterium]